MLNRLYEKALALRVKKRVERLDVDYNFTRRLSIAVVYNGESRKYFNLDLDKSLKIEKNICSSFNVDMFDVSSIRNNFTKLEQFDLVVCIVNNGEELKCLYENNFHKLIAPKGGLIGEEVDKIKLSLFDFVIHDKETQNVNHPNKVVCHVSGGSYCSGFIESQISPAAHVVSQIEVAFDLFLKEKLRDIYTTNIIISNSRMKSGKYSFHNGNFSILGSQLVEIGSYCSLGSNITIVTENHDTNYTATQGYLYRRFHGKHHPGILKRNPNIERTKGGVSIGSDVWIGNDVMIMSGVKIGHGACIGAKALVTKDVPPYSIVAGIPAKKIRMRFQPDIIAELLKDKWWEWTNYAVATNERYFCTDRNRELDDLKI